MEGENTYNLSHSDVKGDGTTYDLDRPAERVYDLQAPNDYDLQGPKDNTYDLQAPNEYDLQGPKDDTYDLQAPNEYDLQGPKENNYDLQAPVDHDVLGANTYDLGTQPESNMCVPRCFGAVACAHGRQPLHHAIPCPSQKA